MLQQPKLSVNRDFLGVQHVTETTHHGNVTKKRSFEVSYTQFSAGMRLFNAYKNDIVFKPPRGDVG